MPAMGVVPEIAPRHLELINTLVEQALQEAGLTLDRLSAIAVSHGPEQWGRCCGVATARLSYAIRRPLIAVNHQSSFLLQPAQR